MTTGKSARFDAIHTVRDHQKKQTTRELSQIVREKKNEMEKLSVMHDEHSDAMTSSFTASRSKATEIQAKSAFIKRLATEIKHQSKKIEKIEGLEEDKRVELLERVKAKNVIEKLQEKVKTEIQKEAEAKERQLLDMVGQRTTQSTT